MVSEAWAGAPPFLFISNKSAVKTQLKYHEVHPLKAHKPLGVGEFHRCALHSLQRETLDPFNYQLSPCLLFLGTISQQMRISKHQVVHLKNMQFLCQLYPNIADRERTDVNVLQAPPSSSTEAALRPTARLDPKFWMWGCSSWTCEENCLHSDNNIHFHYAHSSYVDVSAIT